VSPWLALQFVGEVVNRGQHFRSNFNRRAKHGTPVFFISPSADLPASRRLDSDQPPLAQKNFDFNPSSILHLPNFPR
jgi:hypothetical protein